LRIWNADLKANIDDLEVSYVKEEENGDQVNDVT
jgi:hypothetical protein